MRQKLNIVTLGVEDFQRSLNFYQNGLGWKTSSASTENIAFFQLGGIVFALYPRDKLAEDVTIAPEGHGFSGITLAYNAKNEAEVDEVLRNVEKLGAKIVKKAQKVFWGGYSGYFADLDGHLWEVAWNPFFEFDDSDNLVLP
ncbi:VOC family protein [Mastigocoleus testarum]|uniref:Glyoxalase n=1 Tax=Mastigocoleus testarum BC008 TaxID=371196 RepID=A0A0V7ZZ31_9CYAN|nr:VOC family protein [Mastigocoleus testarum]KST69852.1 glyoxalase [Mastigocoleus testarum BC008]